MKHLALDVGVSADVFRALPKLEKLWLQEHLPFDTVTALLQHPPQQLQCCFGLASPAHQLQQLISSSPKLHTISINCIKNEDGDRLTEAGLVSLLAVCSRIVTLTLDNFSGSPLLVDALCNLPNLCQLTIKALDAEEPGTWDRVPALRAALDNHAQQRNDGKAILNITRGDTEGVVHGGEQGWLSVLAAAPHCTKFDFDSTSFSDSGWSYNRRLVAPQTLPDVLLACMRLHTQQHTIKLDRTYLLTDDELQRLLEGLPTVRRLHVGCRWPAVVERALFANVALSRLPELYVYVPFSPHHGQLAELLQLVRAMTALQKIKIRVPQKEWLRVDFYTIKDSLQHVKSVSVERGDYGHEPKKERKSVALKLLRLPTLKRLQCFYALQERELLAVRRQHGLSNISFNGSWD